MAIEGIIGPPGSGKTYYAVKRLYRLRRLKPDRPIYSNTPLYFPGAPVRVVERVEDLYGLRHAHVLIDEVHAWLPATEWQALMKNRDFVAWSTQMRKIDLDVWYTTQHLSLVVKVWRELTAFSWYVQSWKKLGFFVSVGYEGTLKRPEAKIHRGLYLFNQKHAKLYDTEFRVF